MDMPKTQHNFTLDNEIVERAKERLEQNGGKLSTLINQLLKEWLEENNGS